MSFTGTDYTWGGGATSQTPNQVISQANPLVGLSGTETGATYQEIQEVAGDLYIASNAVYSNGNWTQSDATKASYALRFRSNGSIVERVTAPSGAPTPIVWTTVFSINTAGNTVVSGTLNVTGATTLAGVNVGGAITGATTINASGVITGAGIAAGGAITGATSISMSGALSGGTATFSAPLPIGSGGTGSATQNFVDLSNAQTVGGVKTLSATPVFSTGVTSYNGNPFDFGGVNASAWTLSNGPLFVGSTGGQPVTAASLIATAVAPTTAAGQVSYGATTATTATAGANGAVPAQVVGYIIINVAGTARKIPYFAT